MRGRLHYRIADRDNILIYMSMNRMNKTCGAGHMPSVPTRFDMQILREITLRQISNVSGIVDPTIVECARTARRHYAHAVSQELQGDPSGHKVISQVFCIRHPKQMSRGSRT